MLDILGRNWWVLVLRGAGALIFGLIALLWPDLTVTTIVIVFGAFVLVDGIFDIIGAVMRSDAQDSRLIRILRGVVSIVAGLVALFWPEITALTLLYIVAIWALIAGVVEILAAYRLRHETEGEWLLGLSGVLSILFGLFAIIFPGVGILSLTWLVGLYAILLGVVLILLGFRLRTWFRQHTPRART